MSVVATTPSKIFRMPKATSAQNDVACSQCGYLLEHHRDLATIVLPPPKSLATCACRMREFWAIGINQIMVTPLCHVFISCLSAVGHLRPPEAGSEDGAALHLAQQGQQPLRQPEEGVQRHLLAGGDHPLLPEGHPLRRGSHRRGMLPRAG